MARTVLPTDPAYLKAAFADLGLSEIPGPRHSARVLQLFKSAGHPEIKNDETAWCAAAVGGWLAETGFPNSGSLMARSYAKYGRACDMSERLPRGAIVTWPRGAPPSGHVNICLEDDGVYLTCIGGNQGNGNGGGVTISRERKAHALAARLPFAVANKPVALVTQDAEDDGPTDISARRKEPDTAVVPVDAEPDEQEAQIQDSANADAETRPSWLRRKWKGVTGWLFGGVGSVGIGWLTDPWVVVAIGGVALLSVTLFILWMGPGEVRAWIRKQVS